MKHLILTAICCSAFLIQHELHAQQQHADYVVLGKSINHRQTADGSLEFLNTVFFAEIFAVDGGTVSNGFLKGPGDAAAGLEFPAGDIQFIAGERQYSIEALTEHYPDATYYFNFDTPDGNVRRMPATFRRAAGEKLNPGPIRVSIRQDGRDVMPGDIDPDRDLVISWSPFEKGAADPHGIIDDMIYVIVGDCLGTEILHSGHAISDSRALTFKAAKFVISAGSLPAGKPVQLEVEHSNMETDIWQGMEIIVTYAATSFLDIHTTGQSARNPRCPAAPYAMDGGQTDRERLQ
jgi:hypothetical protein